MSIETKYRPNVWDEVIGQDAVVKSLINAIDKKLGTAFLFIGPSGCGKTTIARMAARELGCDLLDLVETDAATDTGIDDMRKITEALLYKPLGGGSKAIIVDEVHALSKQALTSLLKSLEDPPSWVYWFLCTTDPKKIPVAMKTRCLAYQLKEVRVDDLVNLLASTEEGANLADEIIDLCAEEAGGSPRQALSNLGVCAAAKTRKEAASLLSSASELPAAFQLAQALLKGAGWGEVSKLLLGLKEASVDPESVRHTVRAYMTTVALGKSPGDAFAILEEFSKPFSSADGISPLVLSCGRLILGDR